MIGQRASFIHWIGIYPLDKVYIRVYIYSLVLSGPGGISTDASLPKPINYSVPPPPGFTRGKTNNQPDPKDQRMGMINKSFYSPIEPPVDVYFFNVSKYKLSVHVPRACPEEAGWPLAQREPARADGRPRLTPTPCTESANKFEFTEITLVTIDFISYIIIGLRFSFKSLVLVREKLK